MLRRRNHFLFSLPEEYERGWAKGLGLACVPGNGGGWDGEKDGMEGGLLSQEKMSFLPLDKAEGSSRDGEVS